MSLPIFTERLVLRSLAAEDVHDILALVSHPSVNRITKAIGTSKSTVRKYIDRQMAYQPFEKQQYYDLAIERHADSRVIGLVGLMCEEHQQALIGWALGIEYRGNGYATEAVKALINYAFSDLELHRIYAKTSNVNTASWRLMERVGMRKEAQLRQAELRHGEWIDMLIYAMLAEDWNTIGRDHQHAS